MFEYAQKCLRFYFNTLTGDQSDLEDLIEELLSMSLEDFLSSPPRFSDGELSTTSPDNSEMTDEREVTPLRHGPKAEETVSPSSTSDDQLPPPREPTPVREETLEETMVNGKDHETNGEMIKEEEQEGEVEEAQEIEEEDEGMKTYMSLPPAPLMMPYQPFIPMMYSMPPQFFGYHHPYRMPGMPAPMMIPPPYFMHPHPHIVPPEPQEEINNNVNNDGDTPLSQPEFKATPPESKPAAVDLTEVPVVAKKKSSSPSPHPSPSPPPVAKQPDKQVQPSRQRNTHESRHRNHDSRNHSNHDSYHRGNQERTSKGQKGNPRHSRSFQNRSHTNRQNND